MSLVQSTDLLNAALSSLVPNYQLVSEKEFGGNCEVNFLTYYKSKLVGTDFKSQSPQYDATKITLFIHGLNDKTLVAYCDQNDTTDMLYASVTEHHPDAYHIRRDCLRILFGITSLADDDSHTLHDYRIVDGSTLYMVMRMTGGGGIIIEPISPESFDPSYNYNFTSIRDDGVSFTRGGLPYKRPCGWMRYAIKVTGRYDNGNDSWLGTGTDAWPVTYHGTKNIESSIQGGFKLDKGQRFALGKGIYSTPNFKIAAKYTEPFVFESKQWLIVFQNRVNPNKDSLHTFSGGGDTYWVSKTDDDIRPYGICIKEK